MIVGISIKNFKSIRELKMLSLNRFHLLTGPNASGKTTFLDVFDFIRDCLANGPLRATESRVPRFDDLTWMRQGGVVGIELWLDISQLLESQKGNLFRYRLGICKDNRLGVRVCEESLHRYPKIRHLPDSRSEPVGKAAPLKLLGKTEKGTDFYRRENRKQKDSFAFGTDRSALSLTPPDESRYPSANAIRRLLTDGIRYIRINSGMMRLPCPATSPSELAPDGANLARVVGRLLNKNDKFGKSDVMERWTDHLRYALPDLREIVWDSRQPDNAEYLTLRYEGGLECPGWLASDGTLRMLALTLPAFLPPQSGMYMIEEPENGVHPNALEIIIRSLSSIPKTQVLTATHSPFVIQHTGYKPLLCFSRENGETRIIPGPEHPLLKDWDGTPDLATIFASGALG